jgi:hydroxypyruvate reductase
VRDGQVLVSCASDGHDNTDAAGAVCDIETKNRAQERGLSVETFLSAHDSYGFFKQAGGQLRTGQTGSNVSDLILALQ